MNCLFVGGPVDGSVHMVPQWALKNGCHFEVMYYPERESKFSCIPSEHESPDYACCRHWYRCVEYHCDSITWYIFIANEYPDWQLINLLIKGYKREG